MEKYIKKRLEESANTQLLIANNQAEEIKCVAKEIINSYRKKGKVILMGNGGSATQCSHIAAEFLVRYEAKRPGLEAIALTADTSVITATSNDFGYDLVFEKQIESIADKKDVVIGLTTSGNSTNVLKGLVKSKNIGAVTVVLTGKNGLYNKNNIYEPLRKIRENETVDYIIKIPSERTSVIQEAHLTIMHIICGLVEKKLFKQKKD